MGSGHKILLETSTSCRYRPLRIPVDLPKRYRHRSLGHTHRRDYRHLHHSIGYLGGETVEDGLLTATGSAICGAAAVLGAEPVVKSEPHKTAVAVSTVVIFGTLSMFIYPILYRAGVFDLTPEQMGLYTGSTLHEVAHVVGAGNAMGKEISDSAIIVKMIRVMLLAPVLLIMSFALARRALKAVKGDKNTNTTQRGKISIPWFAFGFLAVIGFNSFDWLPVPVVDGINSLDTFMLTMAMTALGAETNFEKFKQAGAKPFLLAAILYIWLLGGGYLLVKWLA